MLTIEQLKTIKQTPDEGDISLKLLANFYEVYISNRIYELQMEDGTILIFSAENRHFPHLIGLHKFIDKRKEHKNRLLNYNKQLKSQKGFENIKSSRITLEDLKNVGTKSKIYKRYKKRILNFPFSYQLLRESKFLSYDKDEVERDTRINGNYIFVNDINNDKLHFFFIDCDNNLMEEESSETDAEDLVVPITFIVTKKSDFKFVANQGILKIRKVIIKDLDKSTILEEYDYGDMSEGVVRGNNKSNS